MSFQLLLNAKNGLFEVKKEIFSQLSDFLVLSLTSELIYTFWYIQDFLLSVVRKKVYIEISTKKGIYEDGYFKTFHNGRRISIFRAYICFYIRQLELTDFHENYTLYTVFSELFRDDIHFFQKGLFVSNKTISRQVQNPILNWHRCLA